MANTSTDTIRDLTSLYRELIILGSGVDLVKTHLYNLLIRITQDEIIDQMTSKKSDDSDDSDDSKDSDDSDNDDDGEEEDD